MIKKKPDVKPKNPHHINFYRVYETCHAIYLSPSSIENILGSKSATKISVKRLFNRFSSVLKKAKIELEWELVVPIKDGKHNLHAAPERQYWITDPLWRDKLEIVFGLRKKLYSRQMG